MHILLTRPLEDSHEMILKFQSLGHNVSHLPLMNIESKNYELVNLWMDTNLMCIGEKTSAVLNEIKWKKIFLFNPGEEEFLLYKI